MRKIAYDAQAFLSPNGGTGKGAQLRTLIGPYLDQFTGFASTDPNPSGMPLVQEGAAGYTVWQQFSLPGSLRRHGVELLLAPYNSAPRFLPRRVELVLVLHDTILLEGYRKATLRDRLLEHYRAWQVRYSVRRARVVLTVSEYSRGQILARFPRAQVRVIPCTVGEAWFAPRPLAGREGYLLLVTSSAPHKNAGGALRAYARYAQQAQAARLPVRPLKVVGLARQASSYAAELRAAGVEPLVSFLPFIDEAELIRVYQGAAAMLLPSYAEGFGIPMLEAMATGTPLLAARAASLPEVGGEAAEYFDPHDEEDMAAAIRRVLGDERLREAMAARGLARVKRYAPEVVRAQVVAFWAEVAGMAPAAAARAPEHTGVVFHE